MRSGRAATRLHAVLPVRLAAAAVGPGRWFFDYDADEIVIGGDPTGRSVETSVNARAFGGKASGVVI